MLRGKGKVLVAMSGGVDSAVAAALLARRGYEIVGCFMRLGSPDNASDELSLAAPLTTGTEAVACDQTQRRRSHRGCCSVGDAHDARLVAATLGAALYVCNFREDFGRIMDYFVAEHGLGRTPNPCVRCNDWLKFGKLHDYARQIGADCVASGHHARIVRDQDGRAQLYRGVDEAKDQSYVLFGAKRDRLDEMSLPIGDYTKEQVRAMAREMGLPVFDKPDSQEICFVPDDDHAGFVERRAPALAKRGEILDTEGKVVGEHEGQHRFTIGQRRGVGVAVGLPLYVVDKDAQANTITIGRREALAVGSIDAAQTNWLVSDDELATLADAEAMVQFRAHGEPARARIAVDPQADSLHIDFMEPQFGVAPGQAVVCYGVNQPRRVLGGGWIESTRRG